MKKGQITNHIKIHVKKGKITDHAYIEPSYIGSKKTKRNRKYIRWVKIIDNKHISNIFISKNGFSIPSISFNSINETIGKYLLNYKKEVNVIGYLKDNFWNNKKTLQLVVRDLII